MKKLYIFFLAVALAAPVISEAQCKNFVKKKCAPQLGEYIPSDKYNSLRMVEGEEAEMSLIFIADHSYKVVVCAQAVIGDVMFEVLTDTGTMIFSSAENEGQNYFEFTTTSTEELLVVIKIPESESETGMMQQGCVTVMIGSIAANY